MDLLDHIYLLIFSTIAGLISPLLIFYLRRYYNAKAESNKPKEKQESILQDSESDS